MVVDELIQLIQADKKVFPLPPQWARLYSILLAASDSRNPPGPLILGSWFDSSDSEKFKRLKDQIHWANANNCLSEVSSYLTGLNLKDWRFEGSAC